MATFTYKDIEIELPKKTLKVVKGIDDCYRANNHSREKGFREMHKFIVDLIGKEKASEMLDGNTVETVDLEDVGKVFKGIEFAYITSLQDYQNEILAPMLDKVTAIAEDARVMERVSKR